MSDLEKFRTKVTFLAKEAIICPICEQKIYRESLMTGGGRLIAGEISQTLHRQYKPSKTYGDVYPLVYSIIVCPDCFYASMPGDFLNVPEENIEKLQNLREERIDFSNKLIGDPVDFSKFRTLESGVTSYVLASQCYDFFGRKQIPVIKQAICTIRAAYLFQDLEKKYPGKYYKFLSETFYKKALFFYKRAQDLNIKKEQVMENLKFKGPDLDKDFDYDGITYLVGALTYLYGDKSNEEERKKNLEEIKTLFGKLFGMGKSNVNKPKEILEKSKNFYDLIVKELK